MHKNKAVPITGNGEMAYWTWKETSIIKMGNIFIFDAIYLI